MRRSVERVDGVQHVSMDVSKGRGDVWVREGATVSPEALWQAIKQSGFTPLKIEWIGLVVVCLYIAIYFLVFQRRQQLA